MSLNFLALATRTLWPHSSSKRLTQGEWVPTSMAILREYSESKRCLRLSGVVRSLPSSMTSPLSVSIRHRWLYLSPRSSPAVISGRSLLPSVMGRFLLPLSLYGARTYCRPSRRVLRGGSAFSSHLRRSTLPKRAVFACVLETGSGFFGRVRIEELEIVLQNSMFKKWSREDSNPSPTPSNAHRLI